MLQVVLLPVIALNDRIMKRGGPQPKLTKAQEAALLADAEKAEADAADADEVSDGADNGAGDGAGAGGGGGGVEVVTVAEGEVGGTIDNPIMLPKRGGDKASSEVELSTQKTEI